MRPSFRINGIVRTAHLVRQALTRPMSPAEQDNLRRRIDTTLHQIDVLLQEHRVGVRNLPPPSQRAYQFLKSARPTASTSPQPPVHDQPPQEQVALPESVTFRGLKSFLDQVLDDIARLIHEKRFNSAATFKIVGDTANRLSNSIARQGLQPNQLSPKTRLLLGWFRYFAQPAHFDRYHTAVERMQCILSGLPDTAKHWRSPAFVRFAPIQQMYHWKVQRHGTKVSLPTPMIGFDDDLLSLLSRQMMGDRQARLAVTEAMMAPPYQQLVQALEAAGGGLVEQTRGVAHDLAEVFERVNARYFERRMPRPRLTWSRGLNIRVYGHYHLVQDTVTINAALDSADVPTYVLDHVMHHELLHKKLGLQQRGDRHCAHTSEFREQERTFERYIDASAFLERMSRR